MMLDEVTWGMAEARQFGLLEWAAWARCPEEARSAAEQGRRELRLPAQRGALTVDFFAIREFVAVARGDKRAA
jgi:hypothetical protein